MGEKSEGIFASFKLIEDGKKYEVVVKDLKIILSSRKISDMRDLTVTNVRKVEIKMQNCLLLQYISLLKQVNTVIYEKSLFVTAL